MISLQFNIDYNEFLERSDSISMTRVIIFTSIDDSTKAFGEEVDETLEVFFASPFYPSVGFQIMNFDPFINSSEVIS